MPAAARSCPCRRTSPSRRTAGGWSTRPSTTLGSIDILVNNAAVTYYIPFTEFPEKRYRLMFEVQVRAPFELAQMVVPGMRERGAGWILNITSRAGIHPQGPPFMELYKRGFSVYGMVKAALDRFSTGLAAEVYDDGIAVNSLAPWDNVVTPGAGAHDLVAGLRPRGHLLDGRSRAGPVQLRPDAGSPVVSPTASPSSPSCSAARLCGDQTGQVPRAWRKRQGSRDTGSGLESRSASESEMSPGTPRPSSWVPSVRGERPVAADGSALMGRGRTCAAAVEKLVEACVGAARDVGIGAGIAATAER